MAQALPNTPFSILHRQSAILNPWSSVLSPQSSVLSPQSSVRNQQVPLNSLLDDVLDQVHHARRVPPLVVIP